MKENQEFLEEGGPGEMDFEEVMAVANPQPAKLTGDNLSQLEKS